jgi:DNA-binding transcriptional MerR regulator
VTKGPQAFRTISEASDELGVPQHVLRFWETKFSFIRPMKRAGGRRFYRPHDIEILRGVRALLHDEGYTIKGVQRLHKDQGLKVLLAAGGAEARGDEDPFPAAHAPVAPRAAAASPQATAQPDPHTQSDQGLLEALDALQAAKARLERLISGS